MLGQVKGYGCRFDYVNGVCILTYLPVGASFPEVSTRALCCLDQCCRGQGSRGQQKVKELTDPLLTGQLTGQ